MLVMSAALASDSEADDDQIGTTSLHSAAEEEPVAVEVPYIDSDELSSFFITSASASRHLDQHEKEEASIDTFNDIFIDSNDMYVAISLVENYYRFAMQCQIM